MSSNPLRQALGLPALKLNWAEENINETQQEPTAGGGGGLGTVSKESLAGYQNTQQTNRANNAEKKKPMKLWIDALGRTIDAENIPLESLQELFRSKSERDEILAGFNNEMSRLQYEIKRKQSNPVMTVLTTMAGEMASAEGLNPLVRAMGRTARSLSKTPDELRGEMQKIAMATEPIRRGSDQALKEIADAAVKMELKKQAEDQRDAAQMNTNIDNFRQQTRALMEVAEPTDQAGLARLLEMTNAAGKELGIPASIVNEALESIRGKAIKVAADRRQAEKLQGEIAGRQEIAQKTAATIRGIEEGYQKTTATPSDFQLLHNLKKSDEALDRFISEHAKTGGPFKGKTAKLLAWFGNKDAQNLINSTASMQVNFLTSSGQSLARLSENEGVLLKDQLPSMTTGEQAVEWARRFKKINDDTRQLILLEKYSTNPTQIKAFLPNKQFYSIDGTKVYNGWDHFIQERDSLLSDPQRMIQKYPETLARMAGGSNIPTLHPLRSKDGSPIYKNGKQVWVDAKSPNVPRDSDGNPLVGN